MHCDSLVVITHYIHVYVNRYNIAIYPLHSTHKGGFQIKIRVWDSDADADDLVDYFIINVPSFTPTDVYSASTTYEGEFHDSVQITLRYRLRCQDGWYGNNCDVQCNVVNTPGTHLECAPDGSIVCMDGWRDLSSDCSIREFHLGRGGRREGGKSLPLLHKPRSQINPVEC